MRARSRASRRRARLAPRPSLDAKRVFPEKKAFTEWETHLLVGAVEPADAEVHDARLELGAVARERGRASHGAAHRESDEGACVCVAQCV